MIYDLYGLTGKEVGIVEESVGWKFSCYKKWHSFSRYTWHNKTGISDTINPV
jgi:hypothetical protein